VLAIKTDRLIDGTGQVLENTLVLVDGDKIANVANIGDVAIREDAHVIDATDNTVMPGMIDAHLHLMADGEPGDDWATQLVRTSVGTVTLVSYVNAKKNLEAGFTTLRDAGSRAFVDVALRDAIDSGLVQGPRLRVAGEPLTPTGGHADPTKMLPSGLSVGALTGIADSPNEARKAARHQIKMGADFIKISASLTDDLQEMSFEMMQAICEVAHWTGRKVAAHCSGGDAVTDALRAGVDSLEHGRFLTDRHFDLMVENGVYLVPTLAPEGRAMQFGQDALGYDDRSWAWMVMANSEMYDTVARAHKHGVKVAVGSDAAMPAVRHGEGAYEMELLVKAGLSNMEAIVAATSIGAELLGMSDQVGSIEVGKMADIVVVEGDPLADIRILQDLTRIKNVIKGGRIEVSRG
jgi:imidazolonepropionase-like amidohydrolase